MKVDYLLSKYVRSRNIIPQYLNIQPNVKLCNHIYLTHIHCIFHYLLINEQLHDVRILML